MNWRRLAVGRQGKAASALTALIVLWLVFGYFFNWWPWQSPSMVVLKEPVAVSAPVAPITAVEVERQISTGLEPLKNTANGLIQKVDSVVSLLVSKQVDDRKIAEDLSPPAAAPVTPAPKPQPPQRQAGRRAASAAVWQRRQGSSDNWTDPPRTSDGSAALNTAEVARLEPTAQSRIKREADRLLGAHPLRITTVIAPPPGCEKDHEVKTEAGTYVRWKCTKVSQ